MPNQAKWALPICVQKPLVALWRAPVSSTVIQAALESPARSTSRASARKPSWPSISRRTTWRLEMKMPRPAQQRHQSRHRHLPLMVLGQHEAAQLRPEVTIDAGRQRRRHHGAIRCLPALAAEIHHMRTDHQILHHEARVALEAGAARRRCDLDGMLLVDRKLGPCAAPRAFRLPEPPGRFGSVPRSMPLGLMFGRPGPPFNRATSSRSAITTRCSSTICSHCFTTKPFSSACDRWSRSSGGDIPRRIRLVPSCESYNPTATGFAPLTNIGLPIFPEIAIGKTMGRQLMPC